MESLGLITLKFNHLNKMSEFMVKYSRPGFRGRLNGTSESAYPSKKCNEQGCKRSFAKQKITFKNLTCTNTVLVNHSEDSKKYNEVFYDSQPSSKWDYIVEIKNKDAKFRSYMSVLQHRIKKPSSENFYRENLLQEILKFTMHNVKCNEVISLSFDFNTRYFFYVLSFLEAENNGLIFKIDHITDRLLLQGILKEACFFKVDALEKITFRALKKLL